MPVKQAEVARQAEPSLEQPSTPVPAALHRSVPAAQTGVALPQAGRPEVVAQGRPSVHRVSAIQAEPAPLQTSTLAPSALQRSLPAVQMAGALGQKASPSPSTSQGRPEAQVWELSQALPVALQTSTVARLAPQRVKPAVQMGGATHEATPATLPQPSFAPQAETRPEGRPDASHDQTSQVGP